MFGGLPICFTNILAAGPFNPASLSFTGWWRANGTGGAADYQNGIDWDPTASAGSSGSNGRLGPNDTMGTVTYNGHDAADLTGEYFGSMDFDADQYIPDASNTFYIGIVVRARTTYDGDVSAFANLCCDNGNNIQLQIYETVNTQVVRGFLTSTGGQTLVSTTWSLGTEHFVEFWYDGTNLCLRVDGGATISESQTQTANPIGTVTTSGAWHVGTNVATENLDGVVLEHFISDQDLSANGANLLTYIENRYDIDLTTFPRTLALSGWWSADYSGSAWYGQVSAGTSGGGFTLTEATNPPSIGSTISYYTPAVFDGIDDQLIADGTLGDYVDATAWSCAFLIKANTVPVDPGNGARYTVANIASDNAAYWIIAHTHSGISLEMADGGAASNLTVACGTGDWHLVQVKYDGIDLYLRVDDGAWASQTYGNIGSVGGTLVIGRNYNASALWDGQILEIIFAKTALSNGDFDNILAYVQDRYNLTLFTPDSLALTGWWRASYPGSPWLASPSAGTSGARSDMTEATNPPSIGSAVNGFDPAEYDGVDDELSGDIGINFFTASAYSWAVLINIDAIVAVTQTVGTSYDGDAVWNDSGGRLGCYLSGTDQIHCYHWDTAGQGVILNGTPGTWYLVQCKYDGVNIYARLNGGAWSSDAASDINGAFGAATLKFGESYNSGGGRPYFDGKMLEWIAADSALSDSVFDSIRAYCNRRYGVSV